MVRYSLRQLAYMTETARSGGIAQAARQLNVSTAAISAAIDKLEDATGLTLFDRFPSQGVRLTRAGVEFAKQAEALLAQARALERNATDLSEGRRGAIHIGTHFALAHRYVLPAVLAFRDSHPDVRIQVIEGSYTTLLDALDTGKVDALVVFGQGLDSARHDIEVLRELPPLVLLAASHDLATRDRLHISDLADMPYVDLDSSGPGPTYLSLLRAAGIHPQVAFTSQSRELAQAYVGKGLGFTLVGFPAKQGRTIDGDRVVALPLHEEIGHFKAVIARARHIGRVDLVERFLDVCRAQC
ncbi:MAG: LysR family transcriptional regulator [Paracoccaceae bacterium]